MNNSLPFDFALLKQALKKHAVVILLMLLMGFAWCAFGWTFMFLVDDADVFERLWGGVFFLIGIGLLVLNIYLNSSSVSYYYEQGLLKKHGVEVLALIANKHQYDNEVTTRTSDAEDKITIERDLIIEFEFTVEGIKIESEAYLSNQSVFDGLEIGDKIPVMMLPQRPSICHPRMQKIANLVKRKGLTVKPQSENDIDTGEDLMDAEV